MVGQVDDAHAELLLAEGSWELTKYSVEKVGLSQPAMRATGSKTVKMKRGIGGRIYAMGMVGAEMYVVEVLDAMGKGMIVFDRRRLVYEFAQFCVDLHIQYLFFDICMLVHCALDVRVLCDGVGNCCRIPKAARLLPKILILCAGSGLSLPYGSVLLLVTS